MLTKKHVLFNIGEVAQVAEKRGDKNLLRLMEEKLCPFDHTYVMQKPPKQESVIVGPNGQPQIEINLVSLNAFVTKVGTIQAADPANLMTGGVWHKNLYKCPICGRYFKGDWHRVVFRQDDNDITNFSYTVEFAEEGYIESVIMEDEENEKIRMELSDDLGDGYKYLLEEKNGTKEVKTDSGSILLK